MNHIDYTNLNISYDNIVTYSENKPLVIVNCTQTTWSNQDAEPTTVNNLDEDKGIEKRTAPLLYITWLKKLENILIRLDHIKL